MNPKDLQFVLLSLALGNNQESALLKDGGHALLFADGPLVFPHSLCGNLYLCAHSLFVSQITLWWTKAPA